MENKQHNWGSFTSEELKQYIQHKNPVVVLPVGSYEQHGPHLTLDTDTDIGWAIAVKSVEGSTYPCLLLPSLWAGVSAHHMGFCGTVTVSHATLGALVRDIAASIKRHGVKKILLLNSHGGNQAVLQTVAEEISAPGDPEIVLVTYWNLIAAIVAAHRRTPKGGISHACELETSLKIYLKPQDVRMDKLKPNPIPGSEYCSPDMFAANRVNFPRPFHQVTEDGHIGDPTVAEAGFGQLTFEAAVKELQNVIRGFGEGNLC
ncbi:MAG: creatininase family protein [Bacillota bacterium]